jgi:Methane oxygenase PmoA
MFFGLLSFRLPVLGLGLLGMLLGMQASLHAQKDLRAEADALPNNRFSIKKQTDRLLISLDEKLVGEFVFDDPKILRPYFCNLRLPSGVQVTRNNPPQAGVDAVDHDTMHPGLWLGLGDIDGEDFWRNKARMRHVRFVEEPKAKEGRLTFATECRLMTSKAEPLCQLVNRFSLVPRPVGWAIVWDASFHADSKPIAFGDQEEMGFGARVATPITEKNGGRILSSQGLESAKKTWGQPAAWCDYSGVINQQPLGILLMASPSNFRESWWHNRDYGVFVANPFGRQAMRQGEKSSVKVPQGQTLTLRFGALLHEGLQVDLPTEFEFLTRL